VIVTPTEIAELFAEASRLGRPEYLPSGYRFLQRAPGRPPLPPYAVQPLPAERVQTCACGGYLELRQGLRRPVHVGPRGCRARLTV
jgi:hypothetical protein